MNKKNLSVVMAGAMLATSVAPVLADTTTDEKVYEVNKGNLGLLIDKLDTLFSEAPKFDKEAETESDLQGESVYAYQIKEVGVGAWPSADDNGSTDLEALKKLVDDNKEYELRIIDRGYTKNSDGKIVSKEDVDNWTGAKKYGTETFTAANYDSDFKASTSSASTSNTNDAHFGNMVYNADANQKVIKSLVLSSDSKTMTLTLASGKVISLTDGIDYRLDFSKPIDKNGKDVTVNSKETAESVVGFKYFGVTTSPEDIASKVLYNVKIVNGDIKVDYKVDELYDGFMLTDEGHSLLTEIKEANKKAADGVNGYATTLYDLITLKDSETKTYGFSVKITTKGNTKLVSITGTNEDRLETLRTWLMKEKASVDILAGSNRYATAVEIAKEYALSGAEGSIGGGTIASARKNIVLVNGNALVDGLAAAPYAKAKDAPILLTKEDTLPKETKDYLKELVNEETEIGDLKQITVTIIGGTSVVSKNVADEIKDLGFTVKRISGDNREETSLEVADALSEIKVTGGVEASGGTAIGKNNAFVVGADGEADAMSIASYAAASNTPIIVSKSATKGLSTHALNDLSDYTNVTIIGGEKAVPASSEEALKEALDNEYAVERIAGERRQETNAAIIKKYHKGFSNVLVAKDGTGNKSELVDALPVSIFAAANTYASGNTTTAAPIVLATNKLTDSQLNEVVLHSTINKSNGTVYQVGIGVARTVMEQVVTKLGLNN